MSPISAQDPTTLAVGGGLQSGSTIDQAYLITDFDGFDVLIQLGRNDNNARVMRLQIRQTGTEILFPFFEGLLEFGNYWQDINSGFVSGKKNDPPPPPPIG